MSGDDAKPATKIVHAGRGRGLTGPVVNPPVWRASTILYDNSAALKAGPKTNADGHFFYGRRGTPTQWSLAEALTALEPGAAGTMLYSSGVAAVTGALLAVLKPGDRLLMVDSAYDPTRAFCNGWLSDWGVETVYYDPLIGTGIADLITPETRAIFMESPGSLTFEVQDIPAIVAAARGAGVTTLIDNTWATSLFLQPLALGVDISIVAATKYIAGHSDVMAGAVTANAEWYPRLRKTAQAHGSFLGPDDAALVARGLRTLDVRMRRQEDTALTIARWLETRPEVARVLHPALPACPGHEYWTRDFTGASGLFGVVLNGGDSAARAALIDGLRYFGIGYSWGGYESLVVPADPASLRTARRWAAEGPLIRLSIGLEDPGDLIADLEKGLERFAATCG